MTLDDLLISRGQRDVDEALVRPQPLEHAGDVRLVVVPLQAVLLTCRNVGALKQTVDSAINMIAD